MVRLNWVTVRGDDGAGPSRRFMTIIENGVAVLSMWEPFQTWQVDGVHSTEYRRIG